MLIRRCAWHRQHFGFSVLLGIAEWSGQAIGYTDGICRRCAALERRRLVIGDLATTTAARTMRRQAAARAMVLVVLWGTLWTLVEAGPGRRHEAPAVAPPVAHDAPVWPAPVAIVAREESHASAVPGSRPAPAVSGEALPPIRYTAVRLPAERARSWNQLALASEAIPTHVLASATDQDDGPWEPASVEATRQALTPGAHPLAAIAVEWQARAAERPAMIIAFAATGKKSVIEAP